MKIENVTCKSLLYNVDDNRVSFNFYPHRATLNYYLGCKFGCKYCYAWFGVKNYGFNITEFPNVLIVKENSVEILKKELLSRKWKNYRGVIQLGNLQDVYQPLNDKFQITRSVLKLLLRYNKATGIVTKSSLITKDLDILKEMGKRDLIHVDLSIASTEEKLKRHLEPFAPSYKKRFETLEQLAKEGISTGVFVNPALPFYTKKSLEMIFKISSNIGVNYIFMGSLHMRYWKYKLVEEALLKVNNKLEVSKFMSFKRVVNLEHNYFLNLVKQGAELSLKYKIQFATPYPKYTNCHFNFGAFKHRHPLIYDHVEILFQYKDRFVDYDRFSGYYDINKYGERFFKKLSYFWTERTLFKSVNFLTIDERETLNGVEYCLRNDSKLEKYLSNNIYVFDKFRNYGTKTSNKLFV